MKLTAFDYEILSHIPEQTPNGLRVGSLMLWGRCREGTPYGDVIDALARLLAEGLIVADGATSPASLIYWRTNVSARTLSYTRPYFVECPACEAKPGSPQLCRECLERRELYSVFGEQIAKLICPTCQGTPNPECPQHGR